MIVEYSYTNSVLEFFFEPEEDDILEYTNKTNNRLIKLDQKKCKFILPDSLEEIHSDFSKGIHPVSENFCGLLLIDFGSLEREFNLFVVKSNDFLFISLFIGCSNHYQDELRNLISNKSNSIHPLSTRHPPNFVDEC